MKTYRIFFSSPGDVGEERQRARDVVDRLSAEFAGRVRIDAYFWEDRPMRVTADFQAQIPSTDAFDAVVCILWSRLGTPLKPGPDGREWASGTEYEVVTAKEAASKTGVPDILIYRKSAGVSVLPTATECERLFREFERLERFWGEHCQDSRVGRIKGAYSRYADAHQFETKLNAHLSELLREHLGPGLMAGNEVRRTWVDGSPFRGLRAFDCEDAPVFHGRSSAVAHILEALRRRTAAGKGLLVVSGASGSGKSSLVRAGVLPKLTAPGVLEGFTAWRRALFTPGDGSDPFASLAHALLAKQALPELGTSPDDLARRLATGPEAGLEIIMGALRQVASESRLEERHILETKARDEESSGRKTEGANFRAVLAGLPPPRAGLALIVDQLEEAFTQVDDLAQRSRFLDLIAALASGGQVIVLATIRADYWPKLIEVPALSALAQGDGRYDLLAPRPSELEEMITRPALAAGLAFETEPEGRRTLDREILDEAVKAQDPLPLLQFTLESLYQARSPDGTLTWKAWQEIGGLEGALRRHAEKAFRDLPKSSRDVAPDVFRRLVDARLSEHGGLTFNRRWVPMNAFSTDAERAFVNAMVADRLLIASALPGGEATCSLAHEALIANWQELRTHLEREESLHLLCCWMRPFFDNWKRSDRNRESLLPRGGRLNELHAELKSPRGRALFSDEEGAFILASVQQPPPTTVILRQGAAATSKGIVPVVIVLAILWYMNPTLLRDYVGKLRKPTYETSSEKKLQNDLALEKWKFQKAESRIVDQNEALSRIANGLLNQPRTGPSSSTMTTQPADPTPSKLDPTKSILNQSPLSTAFKDALTPKETNALSPFLPEELRTRLSEPRGSLLGEWKAGATEHRAVDEAVKLFLKNAAEAPKISPPPPENPK